MTYNIEYLNSLLKNRVEESLNLNYKAAMALDKQSSKTTEISKDISSMANSDGGIIIYGIKEDVEQKYVPSEIDPINRKNFPKEWLEQIINDKIRPRIDKVTIHPIPITDEGVVYVVEIEKSDTAHQADDKRYYKRFNFQSIPMYDYEIRDILNRQKYPKLELSFELTNDFKTLVVYVLNVGSVFANYVNIKVRLPDKIVVDRPEGIRRKIDNMVEISAANTVRELIDNYSSFAKYWPSRYEPILSQTKFKLIEIMLHHSPFNHQNTIEWDIYCDNATPVYGSCRLSSLLDSNRK